MGRTSQPDEQSLQTSLRQWGGEIVLPETPDLRASVSARLRAAATTSPRKDRFRSKAAMLVRPRVLAVGLPAFMVIAAVLLFLLVSSLNQRPSLDAGTILLRAAHAPAVPGQVTHLLYQVTVTGRGREITRPVNVWSGSVAGSFTAVDVQRVPTISAQRFVEHGVIVSRTWVSSKRTFPWSVAGVLAHTPIAAQDGRLVAATVLRMTRLQRWVARRESDRRVRGTAALVLSVAGPGVQPECLTLAFDARTYTLLEASAAGYSEKLISRQVLAKADTPELIATYLKAKQAQNPPSAGSATY
jgi:hypothetical protein